MGRFAIRCSIIAIALYLILCNIVEVVFQTNIWSPLYYLLFESCVCLCISKQGVYHCRYIKWTAYAILISDTVVCFDNLFDIFPVSFMIFVPTSIITMGLSYTTFLAIKHFAKVQRILKPRN